MRVAPWLTSVLDGWLGHPPQARSGVALVNAVPRGLPSALGDKSRIIQILHNLVGNACKFTHSGSIVVSAGVVPAPDGDGTLVEVSVTDSGIGIPESKHNSIFQAFEQVGGLYGLVLQLDSVGRLLPAASQMLKLQNPGYHSIATVVTRA
jgi:signal transduction histidine kinase